MALGGGYRLWGAALVLAAQTMTTAAFAQPVATPADAPLAEAPPPDACPPKSHCEYVELQPEDPVPAPTDPATDPAPPPPLPPQPALPPPAMPLASEGSDWDARGQSDNDGDGVLTTTGVVVFAVGYVPALLVGLIGAAIEDGDDADSQDGEVLLPLLLPVAGPPITGALTDPSDGVWGVLLADTAIQAVGLVLLGVGLAQDSDDGAVARSVILPHIGGDGRRSLTLGVQGTF